MAEDYEGLYGRALRALSGARDWWSENTDPNRPRKRGTGDVNLPVAPPVEKPWYEKVTSPLEIAEQIGRKSVEPGKAQAKSIGGKLAGTLGATSESSGRAFGALMDATSTGSEKKPLSDVVWEGLKGVKSGYEAGVGATSASQEFTKRAPEETLSGANPVQRGMLGLGLDVVTDPTNLIPEKYMGAGASALIAGADAAWLPPSIFKKAHNIEGFTSGLHHAGDAKKIIQKGFQMPAESDILKRLAHGSAYTPEEGAAARNLGIAPIGSASDYQMRPEHMPIDFNESVKMLDTTQPVPREDIDVILSTLHPTHDENLIKEIEEKWQQQAKWITPHSEVREGKITPETLRGIYESNKNNPVLKKDVKELESVLVRPYFMGVTGKGGTHGKGGTGPLNFPAQTREFGGIYHTDKNASGAQRKSVAWDPGQTLVGPAGSQKDLSTVPWTQGKAFKGGAYKGTIPADAPGGVSVPLPKTYVPSGGPAPSFPVEPAGYTQQQAMDWVAQNIPEPTPKVYPPGGPAFMGKPISTYEQGTLKELEAAGRQLDEVQKVKLDIIKQYESGVPPVEAPAPYSGGGYVYTPEDDADNFAQLFESPTFGTKELADQFFAMSPEAQQAYKQKYSSSYNYLSGTQAWEDYQKTQHAANPVQNPTYTPPEPEPRTQLGKVEVFNAQTGQTLGVFDDHASAYRFMDNHPEKSQLDYETLGGDPEPPHQGGPEWDDFVDQGGIEAATQDMSQVGKLDPSTMDVDDVVRKLIIGDSENLKPKLSKTPLPTNERLGGVPEPAEWDDITTPNAVKAAPPVETTYKLKVPEDEATEMLGGTKNKAIYTKGGQDYLFKEANPPYFADQEVSANKISNLSGLHPIKIEKSTMGGKPGTMQAAVGNNFNWPTLKEVDPKTLSVSELRDIIRNHPVDWLTGNMDAHGGQFLKTPNGIVEVDRGRAFKSYGGNKLDEDYNPTGGFGYEDQLYNIIVKAYKKGDLPQLTEGDIKVALDQTIFKMNQNQGPILKEMAEGLERSGQASHGGLAIDRFMNLKKDLLKFWTGK